MMRLPRFMPPALLFAATVALLGGTTGAGPSAPGIAAAQPSDLDAFLQRVVARRDENWKKLQQYILNEREQIDVTGPGGAVLWGDRRDYTWYVRDGFFVRSPLKVNGVEVSEADRRRYESRYLQRVQRRDRRERRDAADDDQRQPPADLNAVIQQTTAPEFVSSAYFLQFKFDEGRYALVGRETLDGREVLRVEYYPTRLFEPDRQREERRRREAENGGRQVPAEPVAVETRRLMNKTSLVTLWVEPSAHQILKYTFDNVDMDFFPGSWLMRMNEARATMTMSEPFPDVWLPRGLDVTMSLTLALGDIHVRYGLDYFDYRRADVTSTIRIPGDVEPR
jgi:hypothetical protein